MSGQYLFFNWNGSALDGFANTWIFPRCSKIVCQFSNIFPRCFPDLHQMFSRSQRGLHEPCIALDRCRALVAELDMDGQQLELFLGRNGRFLAGKMGISPTKHEESRPNVGNSFRNEDFMGKNHQNGGIL